MSAVAVEHVQSRKAVWQWLAGNTTRPAQCKWAEYEDTANSVQLQEMHLASRVGEDTAALSGVKTRDCAWYSEANYMVDIKNMTQVRLDLYQSNLAGGYDHNTSLQLAYARPIQSLGAACKGRTPNRPAANWEEVVILNESLMGKNTSEWIGKMVSPRDHARRQNIQDLPQILLGNYFHPEVQLDEAYKRTEAPDFAIGLREYRLPVPDQTIAWGRDLGGDCWEIEARVSYASGGWWTFHFDNISAKHVVPLSMFLNAPAVKLKTDSASLAMEDSTDTRTIEAAKLVFNALSASASEAQPEDESPEAQLWKVPEEVRVPAEQTFNGKGKLHRWLAVVNLLFSKSHTWDEFEKAALASYPTDHKLHEALQVSSGDAACQQKLRAMVLDAYEESLHAAGVSLNDDDGGVCVVCLGETHAVLLQPCAHLCICSTCHARIQDTKCPLCRMNIVTHCQYPGKETILRIQRPL